MKIQMTKILDVLKKEKGLCSGRLCGNGPNSPYPPFLGCLVGALLFATGEFTVEELVMFSGNLLSQDDIPAISVLHKHYGLNKGNSAVEWWSGYNPRFGYLTLIAINDSLTESSDKDRLAWVIASLESGMWDEEIALAGGAE